MRIVLISLLSAFGVVALMMAGLGIKILVKKHGQFKRPYSSLPMLAEMMPFPKEETTPPVTKMYFVSMKMIYL